MSDRQGIEIDYCPKCRGVWLDRGELDKIIERSASPEPARPSYGEDRGRQSERREPRDSDYRPHKKRKSLLDDIFDF